MYDPCRGEMMKLEGVLVVRSPLARVARRAAVAFGLAAPWLNSWMFALIAPTALLYGLVVMPHRHRGFEIREGSLHGSEGELLLGSWEYTLAFPERERGICFVRRGVIVATLTLESGSEARDRLLDELGFGEAPKPLRTEDWFGPRTRVSVIAAIIVFALLTLVLTGSQGSIVGLLNACVALLLATAALVHRDVRIGEDGVWVATAFRRWWIGFEQLRGVSQSGLWTRLHTTQGDVDLSPMLLWPSARSRAATERLAHVIRRAHARFERSPAVDPRALARIAQPLEGDFRVAPTDPEDLAAVVESPRALEEDRVSAARTLLRSSAREDSLTRVRIAADRTASPGLELALRAVVDEIPVETTEDSEEGLAERPARRMHEGPVGSVASSHGIAPS